MHGSLACACAGALLRRRRRPSCGAFRACTVAAHQRPSRAKRNIHIKRVFKVRGFRHHLPQLVREDRNQFHVLIPVCVCVRACIRETNGWDQEISPKKCTSRFNDGTAR